MQHLSMWHLWSGSSHPSLRRPWTICHSFCNVRPVGKAGARSSLMCVCSVFHFACGWTYWVNFFPQLDLGAMIFRVTAGKALTNCESGSNSTISVSVERAFTFNEMWSTGDSVGFDLGKLSLEKDPFRSQPGAIITSEILTVDILPGKQVHITYFR